MDSTSTTSRFSRVLPHFARRSSMPQIPSHPSLSTTCSAAGKALYQRHRRRDSAKACLSSYSTAPPTVKTKPLQRRMRRFSLPETQDCCPSLRHITVYVDPSSKPESPGIRRVRRRAKSHDETSSSSRNTKRHPSLPDQNSSCQDNIMSAPRRPCSPSRQAEQTDQPQKRHPSMPDVLPGNKSSLRMPCNISRRPTLSPSSKKSTKNFVWNASSSSTKKTDAPKLPTRGPAGSTMKRHPSLPDLFQGNESAPPRMPGRERRRKKKSTADAPRRPRRSQSEDEDDMAALQQAAAAGAVEATKETQNVVPGDYWDWRYNATDMYGEGIQGSSSSHTSTDCCTSKSTKKQPAETTSSVVAASYWDWHGPSSTEELLDFPTLPFPAIEPSALGKTSSCEENLRCECSHSYGGGEMPCPTAA